MDDQLFLGLLRAGVRRTVSPVFVAFMRLFQFVHKCMNQYATIDAIVDDIKFCTLNGANFPEHYINVRGITEIIDCLGSAQKKRDYAYIVGSKYISICEDAQLVQKVSARGFIINCWHKHKARHLFISFENMNKDPSNDYAELLSIDTGVDATAAMLAMIEQIGKTPKALTSFCGDGDGTNTGEVKGVKGQVSSSHLQASMLV